MESLQDAFGPIGTLAELKEIGADPKKIHACAEPTPRAAGGTKGCPWFRKCKFVPWRDQQNGLMGPLNVGVEIILAQADGGAMDQFQTPCFNYFNMHLHERKRQGDESGEMVRIVAYEGDGRKITSWESVSARPSDPACRESVRQQVSHEVIPFKRPRERFPVDAGREDAKATRTIEIMDAVEREALANALAKANINANPSKVTDAEMPRGPVGAPRKVSGSSAQA